jgi:transposase
MRLISAATSSSVGAALSQVAPFFAKLPPCLVGIEACGTSHHWARELIKLGHEVRLMPPAYANRGKNDAADAEAICEAMKRPTMWFVAVNRPEKQAALSIHRTRDLLVKQRTQTINTMRGLLAEFGERRGRSSKARNCSMSRWNAPRSGAPCQGKRSISILREIDHDLSVWQRTNDVARRLMTIPRISPIGATAFAASVGDPNQFRSGRQVAARSVWGAPARWVTNIFASSSSLEPHHWSDARNTNPKRWIRGSPISSQGSRCA